MKILYDGQIYAAQVTRGINRYFASIIDQLSQDIQPHLNSCLPNQQSLLPHLLHLNLQEYLNSLFQRSPTKLLCR